MSIGARRNSTATDGGSVLENAAMPPRSSHAASVRPAAPASIAINRPSVSSCRTSRPRLAPSDSRTAISRCRDAARASITLDTFAHAATSTRPNAANTGASTAASSTDSGFGVARWVTCGTDAVGTRHDAGHERRQRRLCLCRRRPRLQARQDLDSLGLIDAEQTGIGEVGVGGERNPDVARGIAQAR